MLIELEMIMLRGGNGKRMHPGEDRGKTDNSLPKSFHHESDVINPIYGSLSLGRAVE